MCLESEFTFLNNSKINFELNITKIQLGVGGYALNREKGKTKKER